MGTGENHLGTIRKIRRDQDDGRKERKLCQIRLRNVLAQSEFKEVKRAGI